MKLIAYPVLLSYLATGHSSSLRFQKASRLQSSLLSLSEAPPSTSDTAADAGSISSSTSAINATNITQPAAVVVKDQDMVVIHGHQHTLELLQSACEFSKEGLENATQAWEESKTMIVEKLGLASTSIADAHEDETDQDGTSVLQHLDNALNRTQTGLLMRPKVKGLRLVRDAVNKTSIKACGKYDASEADFQLFLNDLATRLLKSRDAMQLRITQAESEVNKALAVSNHMVKLAENAHAESGENKEESQIENTNEKSSDNNNNNNNDNANDNNEERVTKTVQAVSLNANAGIKAKMYVDALRKRRHALLEKLNIVLELSGHPKIEEKKAEEAVTLPPPSWDTPALSAMKSDMDKAIAHADDAKLAAEEVVGTSSDPAVQEEDASGPEDDTSGDASGPEQVVEEVMEEGPLTPMQLLKQRLDNVTRIASEHLNRTFDNVTETEGDGTTKNDGDGKKSVTRTFVSEGATTTVSTMFHPQVEEDALWKQVKKVEVGGVITENGETESVGASGVSDASGPSEEDELHNRITALENKLSGGESGGASSASGASGPSDAMEEEDTSGGASGKDSVSSSSELLRTIAHALTASDESGPASATVPTTGDPTDAATLRGIADKLENKKNPDPTPFKDSKILDDVANRISTADLKDGDALHEIAQQLSTADATSGMEEGGRDENKDASALRSIAEHLMSLIGDVAPAAEEKGESASGGANAASDASGGESEAESEGASGSGSASGRWEDDPESKEALVKRVADAGTPTEESPSGPEEAASGAAEDASGVEEVDPSILSLKKRIDMLESVGQSGPSGPAGAEEAASNEDEEVPKKEEEKEEKESEKEPEKEPEKETEKELENKPKEEEPKEEKPKDDAKKEDDGNSDEAAGSESHTPMIGALAGYEEVEESHFVKPKQVKIAEPMKGQTPTAVNTGTVGADELGAGTAPATMVNSVSEASNTVDEPVASA